MPQDNLVAEIQEKQKLHAKAQELAINQLQINKDTHRFNIECLALNMAVLRDAIEGLKVLIDLNRNDEVVVNSVSDCHPDFEKNVKEHRMKLFAVQTALVGQLHKSFIAPKPQSEEPEVKN